MMFFLNGYQPKTGTLGSFYLKNGYSCKIKQIMHPPTSYTICLLIEQPFTFRVFGPADLCCILYYCY